MSEISYLKLINTFEQSLGFKNKIRWPTAFSLLFYHLLGIYWCYHYTFPVKWQTILFAIVMHIFTGFGITGGAHRLWSHKAFKANLPLRLILLIGQTASGQNSVYSWVRDHRVHHKFSDTSADPHDASRGLFFSHIGWLMMKRNDEVTKRGQQVDLTDVQNDPLIMFQHRYLLLLAPLFCNVLPTVFGIWLWNENWRVAIAWQWFIRYFLVLHGTLSINSISHHFGYKPYNKKIRPTQNILVSTAIMGEGWHNYHHSFPFDYKASENMSFNLTSKLIYMFSLIGWAYDLREATPKMITAISERLGESGNATKAERLGENENAVESKRLDESRNATKEERVRENENAVESETLEKLLESKTL